MKQNTTTKTTASKVIVSEAEAFAIIAAYTPNVQILEVVCGFYADPVSLEYHQRHEVPGFFQISTDRFEEAPLWNLKSDEAMIKVLEEYASTPDTDPDPLSITDSNVPTRYSGLLGIGATRCCGISAVSEISVIVRGLGPG